MDTKTNRSNVRQLEDFFYVIKKRKELKLKLTFNYTNKCFIKPILFHEMTYQQIKCECILTLEMI